MSTEKSIDSTLLGKFKDDSKANLVEWDGDRRLLIRDSNNAVIGLNMDEARSLAAFIIQHL